jgi:hypothetical protein
MSGIMDVTVKEKLANRENMGDTGDLVDFPPRQCRLIGRIWESAFSL